MYRIRIQEVDVMMLEGFSVPECGAEPPAYQELTHFTWQHGHLEHKRCGAGDNFKLSH
jgi:hypothetical protein